MFDNTPASDNTPGFDFSTYAEARVEKNIDSASYSYSQESHRIDVTHECNTTEVRYGGIERVVRYNDDDYKVYEFMEENRVSDEWIYTEKAEKKEHVRVDKSKVGKTTETTWYSANNPVTYEKVAEPAYGTKFSFKSIGLPTFETSLTTSLGATKSETIVGYADNEFKTDLRYEKNKIEMIGLGEETELKIIINPEHTHNKSKITWAGGFEDLSNLPSLEARIKTLEGASVDIEDTSLMVNSKVGMVMNQIEGVKIQDEGVKVESGGVVVQDIEALMGNYSFNTNFSAIILQG